MSFYFFDVAGDGDERDPEGIALDDEGAARAMATEMIGQMLRDQPRHLWDAGRLAIAVRDAGGRTLFRVVVTAEGG